MNVIQKILRDHYEIIQYDIKPRPVVMENIEKVIDCGDPSSGGDPRFCHDGGDSKSGRNSLGRDWKSKSG